MFFQTAGTVVDGAQEVVRALLKNMIEAFRKVRKARKSQDAEGRAAVDGNIKYLRDAIVATVGK